MADILNMTEIVSGLNKVLLDSIEPVITLFQVVGFALLIYIIFLILKAVFGWRTMSKISALSRDVKEINEKMDVLIESIHDLAKKLETGNSTEDKKEKKGLFKRLFGRLKKKESGEEKVEKEDKKDKAEKEKEVSNAEKEEKKIKEEKGKKNKIV